MVQLNLIVSLRRHFSLLPLVSFTAEEDLSDGEDAGVRFGWKNKRKKKERKEKNIQLFASRNIVVHSEAGISTHKMERNSRYGVRRDGYELVKIVAGISATGLSFSE
ncbi:hypothetical protein TNCV_3133041 [Trichonephila clavipes]|nr:hypothetical protein TNCV_3133041 [Trichonephila clavipes]